MRIYGEEKGREKSGRRGMKMNKRRLKWTRRKSK
jgi:hypothetical protein